MPAVALDLVQGAVGAGDELRRRPAIGGEGRRADRCRDRDRPALFAHERLVAEGVQDALHGVTRVRGVGLGEDHCELVSTVSGRHVRRAERGPDQLGGPRQDAIAEQMAAISSSA